VTACPVLGRQDLLTGAVRRRVITGLDIEFQTTPDLSE